MGMTRLLWILPILSLAACAAQPPQEASVVDRREVTELSLAILELGEGIDPEEAERAARIAIGHARQLAQEYQVSDPPLIHNAKVHMGLRPRGLCYHWAEDMEARLLQENFRTLELHRAISPERLFRLEHSTAIISRKGDSLFDGVILDPWRAGGELFWAPVLADTDYDWRPQDEVFAARRQSTAAREQLSTMSP